MDTETAILECNELLVTDPIKWRDKSNCPCLYALLTESENRQEYEDNLVKYQQANNDYNDAVSTWEQQRTQWRTTNFGQVKRTTQCYTMAQCSVVGATVPSNCRSDERHISCGGCNCWHGICEGKSWKCGWGEETLNTKTAEAFDYNTSPNLHPVYQLNQTWSEYTFIQVSPTVGAVGPVWKLADYPDYNVELTVGCCSNYANCVSGTGNVNCENIKQTCIQDLNVLPDDDGGDDGGDDEDEEDKDNIIDFFKNIDFSDPNVRIITGIIVLILIIIIVLLV